MSGSVALRTVAPWGAIIVAMGLFVFQTISLRGYVSSDFHIFYDAAARSVVDFSAIYKDDWKADVSKDAATLKGFLYPPPGVLAFVPLLLGDKSQAFAVFSALVLLAAALSIWIWIRLMVRHDVATPARVEIVALMLLALTTAPVFINRGGQVGTFILLFCVLGVALGNGRRGWIGGAFLALGGWIKIYPGLLLLAIPLRKQWRPAAIGFAVAAVAIPLASLIVIPIEIYVQYFSDLLPTMSGRAIINIDNQSLAAIWLRAQDTGLDARISFAALPIPGLLNMSFALAALGTIAAFVLRARSTCNGFVPVTAVIMAMIGPLAPLGWGHSYIFILPALVMVLAIAWDRRDAKAVSAALIAWAMLVVPSHSRLPDDLVPELVARIFYARYAIATLILIAQLWRLCGRAALKRPEDRPI